MVQVERERLKQARSPSRGLVGKVKCVLPEGDAEHCVAGVGGEEGGNYHSFQKPKGNLLLLSSFFVSCSLYPVWCKFELGISQKH